MIQDELMIDLNIENSLLLARHARRERGTHRRRNDQTWIYDSFDLDLDFAAMLTEEGVEPSIDILERGEDAAHRMIFAQLMFRGTYFWSKRSTTS